MIENSKEEIEFRANETMSEEDLGQLHSIHNNMNHIAEARRKLEEQAKKPSARECEECGDSIPEARRKAVKGVQYCAPCQEALEQTNRVYSQ
jgi:phage/conjugal plasmid C-4 type zinc finger TraR family protein